MRANELKDSLFEIRDIFASAGISAAENDVARLAEYIEQQGDRDLDEVLAEIREKLDPSAGKRKICSRHVENLKSAGLDESRFHAALKNLRDDKVLDKNDILQILKDYGVIRIGGKSRDSFLESLDKHFYWLLYNRDADAMAKRATPW